MYACTNCGGLLHFDIQLQKLKCNNCDSRFEVDEYEDKSLSSHEYVTNVFECPQCGGDIFTQDNDLTGRCSYCGTIQSFKCRTEKIVRPRWIIPFNRDKEYCKDIYRKAVKKAIFAPKELKNPEYIDSIRGIYMPYWLSEYDYDTNLYLSGIDRKKTSFKGADPKVHRLKLDTHFQAQFMTMEEDASSWYWDEISENVKPFNLNQGSLGVKHFNPGYMCGFYGEMADVEKPDKKKLNEYEKKITQRAKDYIIKEVEKNVMVERGTEGLKKPKYSDYVMALLPVWFLSFNRNNRVSYSVVNGQNGQFAAEFPIDLKKFAAFTAILAGVLFAILNLFWIMRPEYVAMAAAVGAAWAVKFAARDLREIAIRECEMLPLGERKNIFKPERKAAEFNYALLLPVIVVVILMFLENSGYIDRHPNGLMAWLPMIITLWEAVQAGIDFYKYISSTKHTLKAVKARIFPAYMLALLSIITAFVVQIVHPVSDVLYFGVGFLCMFMTLISFIGIVMTYNRMVSRRMPQFDHMGGDENA